jgi:hypothetical protein
MMQSQLEAEQLTAGLFMREIRMGLLYLVEP